MRDCNDALITQTGDGEFLISNIIACILLVIYFVLHDFTRFYS